MNERKRATTSSSLGNSVKGEAHLSGSNVSRRRMLGLTAATGVALAGVVAGQPGEASAHSRLTVEVLPTSFDTVRTEVAEGDAIPTGPFYADGPLYAEGTLDDNGEAPEDAEPVGWWRCWGWTWNPDGTFPSGSAQQSFEFEGLGEIQTQGKDMATKAVIGGSGAFRGFDGEYLYEDINTENATFRVTFVS